MSPRAACRLEQLGFTAVYDYVPGKSDWTAAGWSRAGDSAGVPRAGDIADRAVPTCGLREPVDEGVERVRGDGRGLCIALAEDDVVLGLVQNPDAAAAPAGATIADVMRPGPTTVRANEPLGPLVERMTSAGVDAILVTDPEGRLLGLLDRGHATQVLDQHDHRD